MTITKEEVQKLLDGATPGPWLREAQGIYADNGHKLIASVKSHEHGIAWPTTEANGNIMAAAPDLARFALAESARADQAEAERVSEWNKRRDADASRDVARAACDAMLADRDRLAAANAVLEAKVAGLVGIVSLVRDSITGGGFVVTFSQLDLDEMDAALATQEGNPV